MTDRLSALKELLKRGSLSTQDELRKKLEKLHFPVTQSTISRDLRRIGAIRVIDAEGRVVYRLPDQESLPASVDIAKNMVKSIQPASSIVVIHTAPGTASLVARYLDMHRPAGSIGTIAGDDTVFLAITKKSVDREVLEELRDSLESLG
jgi:transcriptional regulator of arginine metabolism